MLFIAHKFLIHEFWCCHYIPKKKVQVGSLGAETPLVRSYNRAAGFRERATGKTFPKMLRPLRRP